MHKNDYEEVKKIWKFLNSLCLEPNQSVAKSLESDLRRISLDTQPINSQTADKADTFEENLKEDPWYTWTDNSSDDPIYKKSKFFQDFDEIEYTTSNYGEDVVDNVFFKPSFIKEISHTFFPFISLFGKILDIEGTPIDPAHFSNASTEGAFGELKMKLDQEALKIGKRPVKIGRFVKFSRNRINEKAFEYLNDFPRKNFTNRTKNSLQKVKNKSIAKKKIKNVAAKTKRAVKIDPVEVWSRVKRNNLMKHFNKMKNQVQVEQNTDNVSITESQESDSTAFGRNKLMVYLKMICTTIK